MMVTKEEIDNELENRKPMPKLPLTEYQNRIESCAKAGFVFAEEALRRDMLHYHNETMK